MQVVGTDILQSTSALIDDFNLKTGELCIAFERCPFYNHFIRSKGFHM